MCEKTKNKTFLLFLLKETGTQYNFATIL